MIRILATPPLNTVQDLGRPGWRDIGLCQGGAMDGLALRVGNLMVGNPEDAAAIEVQTFPLRLHATADHLLAVTGADVPLRWAGAAVPAWWAMRLPAGAELLVQRPRNGARAYVAVAGGIAVPPVMGSRSTDLRSGFGGHEGRGLQAGDELATGAAAPFHDGLAQDGFGVEPPTTALALDAATDPDTITLRLLAGPDHDAFDAASRAAFWGEPWTVTAMSDRMGARLAGGTTLVRTEPRELRSGAIIPGVVQVPPSGAPLIQLRDANSAGGYPRIGVVAEADLWRLAQAPPGARLRFLSVDHEAAVAARRRNAAYVATIRAALAPLIAA
ncbi:MAG: biotin-dependent carboxyltransferase family protein [Alphaproteobacteria bacterium]